MQFFKIINFLPFFGIINFFRIFWTSLIFGDTFKGLYFFKSHFFRFLIFSFFFGFLVFFSTYFWKFSEIFLRFFLNFLASFSKILKNFLSLFQRFFFIFFSIDMLNVFLGTFFYPENVSWQFPDIIIFLRPLTVLTTGITHRIWLISRLLTTSQEYRSRYISWFDIKQTTKADAIVLAINFLLEYKLGYFG